jgi:hypothetical protein
MANKRRQGRIRRHGDEAGADDTSGKPRLEHLRRSFEAFRREHRAGTHIPQALRDQVLAALSSGTPEIEVLRACRISPLQINWWRRGQCSSARGIELRERRARVFPVVDDESAIAVERASEHRWQDLELRIGQWAISIRQLQS